MELFKLDTDNPDSFLYQTEELRYTLLGGVRLDGLDRMRVTLKVEVINRKFQLLLNNPDLADLAMRHNLDLYTDHQVEKLIRKIAERLEVGSTATAKAIADITAQLESWRLFQIEALKVETVKPRKILSETERNEAELFLTEPGLMQRTSTAIGKSGVVGEEFNRLLMYIIFTSRKLSQPLHVISHGSSGSGKSHLQEKVSQLIPEEDLIEITSLSENAIYYFGQTELAHKLVLIEDMEGAANALFPLRELQSKKRITKTVSTKDTRGITKTVTITVEGPVSVAGCTTKERIYEDNSNRSFLIYLDESDQQDDAVMQYQRLKAAGKIDFHSEKTTRELLQNSQRILQPVTIRNPFAMDLVLPREVFKPRRTNQHLLDFIQAVTFYHQFQREQKVDPDSGEIYIETNIQDIKEANKLMQQVLLRKSDVISGACRNYFEKLKLLLKTSDQTTFTNRSAAGSLRIPYSTIKRYHTQLLLTGLIKYQVNRKTKVFWYEVVSEQEYELLKSSINGVLDKVVADIEAKQQTNQLTSSDQLSSKGELTNPLTVKAKGSSVHRITKGKTAPKKSDPK